MDFQKYLFRSPRVVKFIIVGIASFAFEYIIFLTLFYLMSAPLLVANSFSFVLSLLLNFTLSRKWTFSQESYRLKNSHQLLLFFVVAFVNLGLSNVVVQTVYHFGASAFIAKLVSVVLIAVWNFFVMKKVVFRP